MLLAPLRDWLGGTILEVQAQCQLTCAVACILCSLRSAQYTEALCVVDLRGRRSEVGVVEHVSEGGLKAHVHAFRELEHLRQSETRSRGARSLKAAYCCIAKAAGASWSRRERAEIEVVASRLSIIDFVRDLVRPKESTSVFNVRVRLVIRVADAWREPGSCLEKCHIRDLPTAQNLIRKAVVVNKSAALTKRQLI